ncbi:LytTR family transcriptional regulator DNA-binding domain-containing protein [Marinicrinis sediminis]|uniref:LytTR family transcriptional regulator DNA-binding domain-containing protein n=1 Tax=Marinicrinis sediminis TaxID=1652465 RepID=A0ABW5R8Q0_9BACL
MHIPVLKELENGTTELVMLDLNDVIYICLERRNILYHTENEQFWHISTLSDWEEHLYHRGFELTDKTNLVNFNRIKKMDGKQGKIYFDEHPSEQSKYATIAFIKQKLYNKKIARVIANNTNKSLEIKVEKGTSASAAEAQEDY